MLDNETFLHLAQSSFVAFDLETTGLSPQQCGITEIGAIRVVHGRPTDIFETLVNPGMPVPDFITHLTGISQSMVEDAPRIGTVLPAFLSFLGDDPYVAHNAEFDLSFLRYYGRRCGLTLPPKSADSLALARAFWPHEYTHKLGHMAACIGFSMRTAHRSLADTEALVALILASLERWPHRASLNEACPDLSSIPCNPPTVMQSLTNLSALHASLRRAWSYATCDPRLQALWRPETPYIGQDDVTARLVAHLCNCPIVLAQDAGGHPILLNPIGDHLISLCTPTPRAFPSMHVLQHLNPEEICADGEDRLRFRQLQKNLLGLCGT